MEEECTLRLPQISADVLSKRKIAKFKNLVNLEINTFFDGNTYDIWSYLGWCVILPTQFHQVLLNEYRISIRLPSHKERASYCICHRPFHMSSLWKWTSCCWLENANIYCLARLRRVAPTSKDPDQENTNLDFKTPHVRKQNKTIRW